MTAPRTDRSAVRSRSFGRSTAAEAHQNRPSSDWVASPIKSGTRLIVNDRETTVDSDALVALRKAFSTGGREEVGWRHRRHNDRHSARRGRPSFRLRKILGEKPCGAANGKPERGRSLPKTGNYGHGGGSHPTEPDDLPAGDGAGGRYTHCAFVRFPWPTSPLWRIPNCRMQLWKTISSD